MNSLLDKICLGRYIIYLLVGSRFLVRMASSDEEVIVMALLVPAHYHRRRRWWRYGCHRGVRPPNRQH